MAPSAGLVGFLVTDRDADLLFPVLTALGTSLAYSDSFCDLLVLCRSCDRKCLTFFTNYRRESNSRIRHIRLEKQNYEAEWRHDIGYHYDDLLEAISYQRQFVLDYAKAARYPWLMFLDSDIIVQKDTLLKLRAVHNAHVVCALYQPRWSAHVVTGIDNLTAKDEADIQFLINPQNIHTEAQTIPVKIAGLGCSILYPSVYDLSFNVAKSIGGVKGEDVGFCLRMADKGFSLVVIPNHVVNHLAGGQSKFLFVPDLDTLLPLRTHIRPKQLADLESNQKFEWILVEEEPQIVAEKLELSYVVVVSKVSEKD